MKNLIALLALAAVPMVAWGPTPAPDDDCYIIFCLPLPSPPPPPAVPPIVLLP